MSNVSKVFDSIIMTMDNAGSVEPDEVYDKLNTLIMKVRDELNTIGYTFSDSIMLKVDELETALQEADFDDDGEEWEEDEEEDEDEEEVV